MSRTHIAFLFAALASSAAHGDEAGDERWKGLDEPYLRAVHQRIHRRWSTFLAELGRMEAGSRYHSRSLVSEVVLSVEQDGTVSSVERTAPAGLPGFDDAPADLMRDVGRLPAPPAELHSDDGRTYLRWRFARRAPGCEERAVIERRLPMEEALPRLIRVGRIEDAVERVAEARREHPESERALLLILTDQLGRVGAADPDPRRREAAAGILAHLEDGEALLLALATDPVPSVRQAALAALAERPRTQAAAAAATAALASPEDRPAAARSLSLMRHPDAIAPLRKALADGSASREIAAALAALGDGPEATRVVLERLAGPPQAAPPAPKKSASDAVDEALMDALLAGICHDPADGGGWRAELVDALAAIGDRGGPEARRAIQRALGDASPRVRSRAASALATLPPDFRGRVLLIDHLADEQACVRAAVASALVRVGGDTEDTAWELGRAARDRDPEVRIALGLALAAHPSKVTAWVAAKLTHDPHPMVRLSLVIDRIPAHPRQGLVDRLLHTADGIERLRAAAAWRTHASSQPSVVRRVRLNG